MLRARRAVVEPGTYLGVGRTKATTAVVPAALVVALTAIWLLLNSRPSGAASVKSGVMVGRCKLDPGLKAPLTGFQKFKRIFFPT